MPAVDWSLSSTIASALATVALTFFAGVELWRERQQASREDRAAEAKASAIAFLLRRQLLSWLSPGDANRDDLETWLRASARSGALHQHFDVAESRFQELLAALAEGASPSAKHARKAFVLFLAGTGRLNRYTSTPRPNGPDLLDWIQLLTDAQKDLKACIDELVAGPVGAAFLNEAGILERQRQQEEPIYQLAEAIRQQDLERGLLPPSGSR